MTTTTTTTSKSQTPADKTDTPGFRLSPADAAMVPLSFVAGLLLLCALPAVQLSPAVLWSFRGAAAILSAWAAVIFVGARLRRRTFTIQVVLKRQHYLQACLQGTLIAYWGWHWRQVYDSAHLILAQLLFAYAFDILLSWSRRDSYQLGFGPFPVIFSITLFFWFKDNWFYYQFLLVACGFAAKEFLRWNKDGRSAHIFNPSSFPLALFSVVLLLTSQSDMTWGFLVANTEFYPPHMYLVLFLIGMPGQFLFGVTTMTMSAVVTTYLFSLIYFFATGSYFFDSHVPIAVFLGMHLLFTDPSTAPRTELGRIIFGISYGLSTVLLYDLLLRAGMPGFYDKLLQVPLLNLSIKAIDRLAQSNAMRWFDPAALGRALAPRRRHLVYISIWALAFTGMSVAGDLNDSHPGQWIPFWQQACASDAPDACKNLQLLEEGFCRDGSGWACNELGVLRAEQGADRLEVAVALKSGCGLGFATACKNNVALAGAANPFAHRLQRSPPPLEEYPIILRGSKGPIKERDPQDLYALACKEGWPGTCPAAG